MSSRWDVVAKPLLAVLGICLGFLVLECSLRVYHRLRYDVPLPPGPAGLARYVEQGRGTRLSSIVLDDVRGWRATPGYRFEGSRRNGDGSLYQVSVSFDGRGFRLFGDRDSGRPKVLVVGDSFTQAVEASDGMAYYARLRDALGVEMFAYGAGGYGTLQEYLALDEYLDEVRPDLLLWQYCSNDLMNNLPALERRSRFSNNGLVRPYWVEGEVRYLSPKPDPLGLRTFAVRQSRLAYWALSRWDALAASAADPAASVEREIEQLGWEHEALGRSIAVTDELIAGVRRRVGGIPVVAFSCDDRWPYHDALREVSERNGIRFVAAVGRTIDEAEQRGEVVKVEDGHWNESGHRIVAEQLLAAVRDANALAR